MNDMSTTIIAKSDQINAADLIGITKTITIREVKIKPGEDQPVSVYFEGDQKAFRPCKGVRRLMVRVWGPDASRYVGQSMTLFQDPTVTWAGKPEGGIRVSHMTGLSKPIVESMRTSRAATKPYEILPLQAPTNSGATDKAADWTRDHLEAINNASDADDLAAVIKAGSRALPKLERERPELHAEVTAAYAARQTELASDDPFGGPVPGKPAEDTGEGFTDDDYAATVTNILAGIETALGEASWEAAKAEYLKHTMELPKPECDRIEAALQAKKGALGL